MRILILHNRYKLHGGEDVVVQQEAMLLRDAGFAVDVVEVSNDDIQGLSGKLTTGLTTLYSPSSRKMVQQRLEEHRADLLHVHNFFPKLSPSVYDAAAATKCAVVQTLHNYRLVCPGGTLFREGHICTECLGRSVAWPSVQHNCYRGSKVGSATIAAMSTVHRALGTWREKVHRYIVLNDFALKVFMENAGLPEGRIRVKPNVVFDSGLGPREGGYALFVGRLSPEKGIDTLLQAAARPEFPFHLQIVGTGPLEPAVVAAAKILPQRITYLGAQPRERVVELVGNALVQIVASAWHGAGGPLTVGEAFAAGVPVVTTRLEPMATVVSDGVSGLLYTPCDPADLCRALQEIAAHPERMPAMRAAARRRYENMYLPQTNLSTLLSIYREAIAEAQQT